MVRMTVKTGLMNGTAVSDSPICLSADSMAMDPNFIQLIFVFTVLLVFFSFVTIASQIYADII